MSDLKYSVVEYDTYLTYAIWTPEREDSDFIIGYGTEVSVIYPIVEYIYPNDYPNNSGWNRLLKSKIFKNQRGEYSGQGCDESGTMPLFNLHYSLPVIFRAFSHKDYKALFTILMALALVDSKNRFGTEGVSSFELSPEMLNFLERTDKFWGSRSAEIHMKAELLEEYDSDNWEVKLPKNKILDIEKNVVLQSKAEFKRRIFYKKYSNRVNLSNCEQLEIDWPQ
jgi:hypothetical protein